MPLDWPIFRSARLSSSTGVMGGSDYSEFPNEMGKKFWSSVVVPVQLHGGRLVRRPASGRDLFGAVLVSAAAVPAIAAVGRRWLHKARDRPPRLLPIRLGCPRFARLHVEAIVEGERARGAGVAGETGPDNRRDDRVRAIHAEYL